MQLAEWAAHGALLPRRGDTMCPLSPPRDSLSWCAAAPLELAPLPPPSALSPALVARAALSAAAATAATCCMCRSLSASMLGERSDAARPCAHEKGQVGDDKR